MCRTVLAEALLSVTDLRSCLMLRRHHPSTLVRRVSESRVSRSHENISLPSKSWDSADAALPVRVPAVIALLYAIDALLGSFYALNYFVGQPSSSFTSFIDLVTANITCRPGIHRSSGSASRCFCGRSCVSVCVHGCFHLGC